MNDKKIETFYPETKEQWRDWLEKNHTSRENIWLIQFNKSANKPGISWSDAVDEALCFGWIDSVKRRYDEQSTIQYFSKRKSKGTWSKINKDKVAMLIANGKMTKAGLDCIESAKANGSWEILDEVDAMVMPDDLLESLKSKPIAHDYFLGLSLSTRKAMLQWLVLAKRAETRQKRVDEIVSLAAIQRKPKQF